MNKKKFTLIVLLLVTLLPVRAFADTVNHFSLTWTKKNGIMQGIARYEQGDVSYEKASAIPRSFWRIMTGMTRP